uniref:Coiled-coil domain containing 88B n=1 Tax=Ornithorhynchus anatinus TaxID=9258 RepID=F6ZGD9_ORNAN
IAEEESWEREGDGFRFAPNGAVPIPSSSHPNQEELQLLILTPPPDLQILGLDPLSDEAVEELEGILKLMLGASVQCEHREFFIRHIQGLSLEVQSELAAAIQEVTQPGGGAVLAVGGPELAELEQTQLELMLRSLMGALGRLVRERDRVAQRLAELLLEQEAPTPRPPTPAGTPRDEPPHHLALQLADAKAQLRRLRQELEEKAEELLDSQGEVQGLEAEIRRLRQEAQALSGAARRAGLYREEAEALRERAGRLPRLQEELRRCRERLQALEACQGQLEEERALSGALEAARALLEGQLETARERCARLHESQRENLLLRARLGEAHAELDSTRQQLDHLLEENVELEAELRQTPPPFPVPSPVWAPSLQEEVREAEMGQLRKLERENRELRARLWGLRGQPPTQVTLAPLLHLPSSPTPITRPRLTLSHLTSPRYSTTQPTRFTPQMLTFSPYLDQPIQRRDPPTKETPSIAEAPGALLQTLPEARRQEAESLEPEARRQEAESLEPEARRQEAESQEPEGRRLEAESRQLEGRQRESQSTESEARRQKAESLEPEAGRQDAESQEPEGRRQEAESRQLEGRQRESQSTESEARRQEAESLEPEASRQEGEREALREEQGAQARKLEALERELEALKGEQKALQGELEAQGRRLEARASEAALLGEELARVRRTEAEAQAEAEAGARERDGLREALEAAGRELEAAGREREALGEALGATGRERRQWEREGLRLRTRAEQAEEKLQALEREGRERREEAERERRESQALREVISRPVDRSVDGIGSEGTTEIPSWAIQGASYALVTWRTLAAEKAALQAQLRQLEGQVDTLHSRSLDMQQQQQRTQAHTSQLQAEKAVLEAQGRELRERVEALEEEVRGSRRAQEEAQGQQRALLRDHEALGRLQRRQEAELEGLLGRHRELKADNRLLELEHKELQGRYEQLQVQRAQVEAQEVSLRAERERLAQDGLRQRGLEEALQRLQGEHDRAQVLLAEASRERGELQGERKELRTRVARLELERAQLEAQGQTLRDLNQKLDLSVCKLTTQCQLLTDLRGAQEEENRQLLAEVQALSRENRGLMEQSLESRDHLHREQREYVDQLNALRREKQKLVEKIMDQYRVLEPGPLPRPKKGSWLADKVKRLMRHRREGGGPGGLHPGAEGVGGSMENLGSSVDLYLPEGREAEGPGSGSPTPMRRAQSSWSLRDEAVTGGQRRKLSSRLPVVRGSESFSPGDSPRQRFRQRRPAPQGGAPGSRPKGETPRGLEEGDDVKSSGPGKF